MKKNILIIAFVLFLSVLSFGLSYITNNLAPLIIYLVVLCVALYIFAIETLCKITDSRKDVKKQRIPTYFREP